MDKLTITHNAGFFSCCTVRLHSIIEFYNNNGKLPDIVDSSAQFAKYKNKIGDITYDFFEEKVNLSNFDKCSFHFESQFMKYNELDFNKINKFVQKYFYPSDYVGQLVDELQLLYNIDSSNTCSVFYRGNDKSKETNIGSYDEYVQKAYEIQRYSPDIRFHIQSDEKEFVEHFQVIFPNSFWFDETPIISKSNTSVHDIIQQNDRLDAACWFLAATIIVSKSKFIITHSGNCGLWAVLYRGNFNNVYQYLDHTSEYSNYKGWIC